ncbi:immunity 49 family protein [Nocardiopsis exhalans]|uniref:Immunity 49 family protein n=1 Tax=Nocardiopsis exhalans TaxID=163604 RepID=A0ABY5D0P1_9ACTN|nr:immunity 49 family protein [Nocardiopsis exhalans]USY17475.1 immunity 49 family protein [Nocardiopsis exhalans]
MEEHPGRLKSRSKAFLGDARIALAVDPVARYIETWYAWTAAMQMYRAIFAVSTTPDSQMVECMIDHKRRTLKGSGPQNYTSATNLITAFELSVTCRDQQLWDKMAAIPVEVLRESGESWGTTYGSYIYPWVAAIQAFMRNDREALFRELEKAIVLTGPEHVTFGHEEVDKLVFPVMNTFRCLIQFDAPGFNEALAQGLELHKDYYTADEERSKHENGIVPLGLLAMACMAYDRNRSHGDFPLEVESDYLPDCILRGAWYGEFDL